MRRPASVAAVDVADELARSGPSLVLVDCFGTLVRRRVPSGRVRELACADVAASLGWCVGPDEVLARRRRLERSLTEEVAGPDHPRDHRFADLATALAGELAAAVGDGVDAAALAEVIADVEVATEARCADVDRRLADGLRALDVPVWLVSDTNLSEAQLGALLDRLGVVDVVDAVVSSADAGEAKRSGALFQQLLDRAGVDPERVAMIGDNPLADGRRAEAAGIRPVLVAGGRWDATKQAPPAVLRRDVARHVGDVLDPAGTDDVFPELALTLWWFTTRLDAALRAMGGERAVFLAREGRFLQGLFDRHQRWHDHLGRRPVPSSYLLTSRRSTFLPALIDPTTQLGELAAARPALDRAGLAPLLQLDEDLLPEEPTGEALVAAVLGSAELVDRIEVGRAQQAELLARLVAEADPGTALLHTVDVGWKGTVRDHLARALGGARPVHAHLLGLVGASPVAHLDRKVGHLFSNQPRRTPHFQVLSHFKELYELVLAAPHGSAARYEAGADGAVVVRLDDSDDERRSYDQVVGPLQERTEARFQRLLEVLAVEPRSERWLDDLVARHHARMLYRPTTAELDAVESLVQLENFGGAALKAAGMPTAEVTARGLRRHVGGGGWPPLRMRRAGVGWQRHAYGAAKQAQLRMGRLR